MRIEVENYTIYEKGNELVFEIAADQFIGFPFLQTDVYISQKNIEKGVFFISTKDKKELITFKNMNPKDIKNLKRQKQVLIALLEYENKYKNIYEMDIIKIK